MNAGSSWYSLTDHYNQTGIDMCTIIILKNVSPHMPLIIAGNRDEDYDRPSTGPSKKEGVVYVGRDERLGGTWAAFRPEGYMVACTNQRMVREPKTWYSSRGLLVRGEARYPRSIARLTDIGYKPFNVLVGGVDSLQVYEFRNKGGRPNVVDVPDGIHVLPNDSLDHPDIPKVARAKELLKGIPNFSGFDTIMALRHALADHHLPAPSEVPFPPTDVECDDDTARKVQSICVHAPTYGTVSSFILGFDRKGCRMFMANEGPPCQDTFADYSHLL